MGVYDEFYDKRYRTCVQIKAGAGMMNTYKVGEDVSPAGLPDGVYLGYGGAVVISGQKLVAVYPHIRDKWGGIIKPEEVVSGSNPIGRLLPCAHCTVPEAHLVTEEDEHEVD